MSTGVTPCSACTHAEEIRLEIETETERHLKKSSRAVSPDPIYLTVYSTNVPNLTLVDMPGKEDSSQHAECVARCHLTQAALMQQRSHGQRSTPNMMKHGCGSMRDACVLLTCHNGHAVCNVMVSRMLPLRQRPYKHNIKR